MTDEEAEEMLKKLSKHFGEPVMPVKRYCRALNTWADCMYKIKAEPYYKYLFSILRDIDKSNLLYRLIYVGEEFRTEKCPQCEGRWNGSVMIGINKCKYECEGTGWLHKGWELKALLK